MSLILPQMINIVVTSGMVSYYESLGYNIPRSYNEKSKKYVLKKGTKISVHILDLKPSSNYKVQLYCDCCGKYIELQYDVYNRYKKDDGSYFCHHCMNKNELSLQKEFFRKESVRKKLIEDLKLYILKNGYPNTMKKDFVKENGLSSCTTYKKYFGGSLVDWIELCGYMLSKEERYDILSKTEQIDYSKNEVIEIILKMQSKLNRPLIGSDFKNPTCDTVGFNYVKKYFGTLNNMKKELGLEIVQESMYAKSPSKQDFIEECNKIKNLITSQGRTFTTTREIDDSKQCLSYACLDKTSKKYFNISFVEYMENIGVHFSSSGSGIVNIFDDGEKTLSRFEYMFSSFLKNSGLKYNEDYFRDVKYSDFIDCYDGLMNCDYVINHLGKTIYIEIAGIIEEYKTWYYSNKPITHSKSKEKYRQKLMEKERLLKDNNLCYFILFPCDLTIVNFEAIIQSPTSILRKEIESHYKNNIDWLAIDKIGELSYTDKIGKDGNLTINYEKTA